MSLKNSQISQVSTCAGVSFSGLKAYNFIKKRPQRKCFPVNIAKLVTKLPEIKDTTSWVSGIRNFSSLKNWLLYQMDDPFNNIEQMFLLYFWLLPCSNWNYPIFKETKELFRKFKIPRSTFIKMNIATGIFRRFFKTKFKWPTNDSLILKVH